MKIDINASNLMKLDLKSILIIISFVGFAIFFTKWFLDGSSHKKENKKLKSEIAAIQKDRDNLKKERVEIDKRIVVLEVSISESKNRIEQLNVRLAKNQEELKEAKSKLSGLESDLSENKKKIQYLKDHPIKRTGGDLLNSLKEKSTK